MGTETDRVLAGRYLLGARLGRGGMGTVWRATDQMLDREVAVKELSVGHLAEEDLQIVQSRMKQEARAAARIKHPGVITIHDVLEQDGKPWIVMELIDGRSLSELVEQEGVVDPREAARIGAQVLSALDRGHQLGVIHRDVKPANVLLERATGRVVLTDFGIATFVGDSALTRTGDLVGSPDYLAPERVHGGRPGPESDLWALGATLYAAVEGESPFRRESPLTTLAAVVTDPLPEPRNAGALAPVLRALMAKEPQDRPPASDVLRMLESVAAGHTTNITLGPSPLRTPTQSVPAVDRLEPAENDGSFGGTFDGLHDGPYEDGHAPTALGTVVSPAVGEPTAVVTGPGGTTGGGKGGGKGRISGPTGPTARVPAQGNPLGTPTTSPKPGTGSGDPTAVVRRKARRGRAWAWLLVAAIVAGGAGAGVTYLLRHHTSGSGTGDGTATSPASPSASPSPVVGPGYVLTTDTTDPQGHFSFGMPDDPKQPWSKDASGGPGRIDYTPDQGEHLIRFGVTVANPLTPFQQAENIRDQVKTHDKTFQEISLGQNTYQGRPGAQLAFYYTDAKTGEHREELEQFWKAADGTEYDFLVSYPQTDWDNGYNRFEEVMATFTALGAQ
ncbi:serine/threonine-protein kinase [Streptacidiphilus fuscans]|uniref:serine/threonine-protein kinase n=1 Tax=Streptacidiphilus fuscans TaxID=2789292 RepID=UPI002E2AD1FC|nr:serine/threonine-protein kinase [Streptacidiphilus fuscans]